MEEKFYYSSSKSAERIKDLSYLLIFLSIIGAIVCGISTESTLVCIISGCVGLVLSIFVYGLGEIISLLHDIRENTEHLRDNIERR